MAVLAKRVLATVYLLCLALYCTEGQSDPTDDDTVQPTIPPSTTTQAAIQCDNPMMRPRVQESIGDVPVCVTVTTGDTDPPEFDLFVTVTEGSATSEDFVLLNSEPPLSPMSVNGRQTVCTNIEIINDDEVETTESFTVGFTLRRSVENATLATCEVLILDDDIVECSDHLFLFPESAGEPEVCVAVNGVPENDTIISQIGVNVIVTEESATSDDFQLSESATLRSTGGGVQACTIVEIIDDEEVEGEERFTIELTLSRPAIGSLSAATASCSIEVRILDNDIECISDTVTYSESAGERMVCVVARGVRQSNSEIAIEVTANGNATRREDFRIFNQPFFVEPRTAAEEVQACTSVEIIDDELEETTENFIIEFQLTGFVADGVPPSRATCSVEVWIQDNDIGDPLIECEFCSYSVREGGSVEICGVIENAEELELPFTPIATIFTAEGVLLDVDLQFDEQDEDFTFYCGTVRIPNNDDPERAQWAVINITTNISTSHEDYCWLRIDDDDGPYVECVPEDEEDFDDLCLDLWLNITSPDQLLNIYTIYSPSDADIPSDTNVPSDPNSLNQGFCLEDLDEAVEAVIPVQCSEGITGADCTLWEPQDFRQISNQSTVILQTYFAPLFSDSVNEEECLGSLASLFATLYMPQVDNIVSSNPRCRTNCVMYTVTNDCERVLIYLRSTFAPEAYRLPPQYRLEGCQDDSNLFISCCGNAMQLPEFCTTGDDDNGNAGGGDSSLVYATAGAAGGFVVVLSVIVTVVVAVTIACAIKRKHLPAHHNTFESEMTDTDVRISTSYNKAYGIVAQHSATATNGLVISQNQIADEPEYDYVQ